MIQLEVNFRFIGPSAMLAGSVTSPEKVLPGIEETTTVY